MRGTWRTHRGRPVRSISEVGFAEKLNQWFGGQSRGSKYGTERREINAEEVDTEPEEATQRQQRLRKARRACVINTEATRVTQKPREVAQSLSRLTQRVSRCSRGQYSPRWV